MKIFKKVFPNVKIVQLGTAKCPAIVGVDYDMRAKTTLKEASAILANAKLHIDADCGFVHIAMLLM